MLFNLRKYLRQEAGTDGDAGGAPDTDTGDAGTDNLDGDQSAGETGEGEGSDADTGANDDGSSETGDYADFTMPEGVTLDKAMLEVFAPIMKDVGLDQEQAQKLVDAQAAQVQAQQQQMQDSFSEQVEGWLNETKADKVMGGDNFEETAGFASKAIESFGTPELKTLLNETGLGNHPEMVRLMSSVGRAVSEDKPGGGTPPAAKESRASILYPEN